MINFSIQYHSQAYPFSPSSEEAAAYFNSIYPSNDYLTLEPTYQLYQPIFYQPPTYTQYYLCKPDCDAERSTADSEDLQEPLSASNKNEVKLEGTENLDPSLVQNKPIVGRSPSKKPKEKNVKPRKEKQVSLKKNTEVNLVNNIISYVCSEIKSHKTVKKLMKTTERKRIFYIFMNTLKKLNRKYTNRHNVTALLELTPNQPHEVSLSKSFRRLQVLPLQELRVVLRRMVYEYLRTDTCLLPILTSKKICRVALKEHMEKRRELLQYFFREKASS